MVRPWGIWMRFVKGYMDPVSKTYTSTVPFHGRIFTIIIHAYCVQNQRQWPHVLFEYWRRVSGFMRTKYKIEVRTLRQHKNHVK